MQTVTNIIPSLQSIEKAAFNLNGVVKTTPFERNERYSTRFDCDVYFKREDLQSVRSYKIRGAYNKISSIPKVERE
ncbi:MAG: threonine dehydratase, partial [Flavobacteriaceae bacterium]|nr:threonine dehydratase [Flavobacteriaceae bacterium]